MNFNGTPSWMYTPTTTTPLYPANSVSPQPAYVAQPQGPQLVKVNGMDSAKAYPTVPNAMYALFDANDDVFYIKETDASNFPTIRRFRFVEETEPKPEDQPRYVTVKEFEDFKMEVLNAQQSIQESSTKPANWKKSDRKSDANGQG